MTYTYPSNDYQRPQFIRTLLGSIWTNFYEGRALIDAIVRARADIARQNFDNLKETEACVSRATVPVFHRQRWYYLPLLLSGMNTTTITKTYDIDVATVELLTLTLGALDMLTLAALSTLPLILSVVPGDGSAVTTSASLWRFNDLDLSAFNGSPEFRFDYPFVNNEFAWQLPADIIDVSLITNRITDPSVVLTKHIDFRVVLDRHGLMFTANPFSESLFARRDIFTDGEVTDQELSLWLCCTEIDWDLVYAHFGHVLALKLDSSEAYKQIINCVLDGITGGTAIEQIERAYSMMTGIPLVVNDVETVEDIAVDATKLLINTDQRVYKFQRTATAAVNVNDVVYTGDSLITGFERLTPNRGQSNNALNAIVLGKGMLANIFNGELGFENKAATVTVSGSPGDERAEWEISGHPLDVRLFWDTIYDNRLIYGQSLYDLLKAEDGPFPATVNPMQFMLENVLRNNTVIFIVDANDFGDDALGLGPGAALRRIVPPHSTILMVITLSGFSDSVTMENVDDTEMSTFDGMPLLADPMTQTNVSSYFSCNSVSFTCS